VTPSFGASTPPAGLAAEVVFLPPTAEDDVSEIAQDVRGKLVVATGLISPESVWRSQRAGAAGVIHVNVSDVLHEMTATTIWGTPTTESAARLPRIPVVSIGKGDGARLKAVAAAGGRARIVASVGRGWTEIPLIVAELPGRTPEFVLVATHLDAWYSGMTDTGGTVASILEMARVLRGRPLERGVRFAWWPGHSFGRYAGSTWYADHFWAELERHCVAYTNLDGSGRRGSRVAEIEARGWPGLLGWSRAFAATLTGKQPLGPTAATLFRPGRDSDSAFQGLGIPEFAVGVPGPPEGHPDVEPAGLIAYWHTAQDTLDKLDLAALALDTRYRVAQIADLASRAALPHRIAPIAGAYRDALAELQHAAAASFDLAIAQAQAARLLATAERLDAQREPAATDAVAARNRLLVRVTHRLNSTLYTRAGRFDQDWAAALPILPLLARARELPALPLGGDAFGFLETELIRGRNAVVSTLADAADEIDQFLSSASRAEH